MADNLLMGTARPLFRYSTNRYVLNNKPSMIQIPLPFVEEFRQNNGVFSPRKIFKHSDGFRPEVLVTWDYLDRPSVETLLNILEQDEYFYMRPHFNFYKEYEMVCLNKGELLRFKTLANPYRGTLAFTGRETITTHSISKGAFSFDGNDRIYDNSLGSTISGDMTVEMWIKTPDAFGSSRTLFMSTAGTPTWVISLNYYMANPDFGRIQFTTGGTHTITSDTDLLTNKWYFLQIRRVTTTQKYILVDGVQQASGSDSHGANSISGVQIGDTSNAFQGLCQILRIYNDGIGAGYYPQHALEAIGSSPYSNMKVWWDFSQGDATDLKGNNNGTVIGVTSSEESFSDNGQTYLT